MEKHVIAAHNEKLQYDHQKRFDFISSENEHIEEIVHQVMKFR